MSSFIQQNLLHRRGLGGVIFHCLIFLIRCARLTMNASFRAPARTITKILRYLAYVFIVFFAVLAGFTKEGS